MGNSIILPPEDELIFTIQVSKTDSVSIDAFELEDLFMRSEKKATEQSTEWQDEFPTLFKKETGKAISKGQSVLLWFAHKQKIESLKKNLLIESEPSKTQESPSKRTRKKKSN